MADTSAFDNALQSVQSNWDTALATPAEKQNEPRALDQRTLKAFEDSAVKYNVPVDVLMAMAEKDSGFDATARSRGHGEKTRGIIKMSDADLYRAGSINPYLPEQNIDYAASKLRGLMDSGNLSVPDAVKAFAAGGADQSQWGPDAHSYADDVLARTQRLKNTYYPPQPEPEPAAPQEPQKAEDPGVLGNLKDAYVALDQGMNMISQDVDGVARKVLPTRVMDAIDTADRWLTGGKTGAEAAAAENERLQKEYSPRMRESLAKKWWDSDKGSFGGALTDWRSYAGAVLQSLPESMVTSGPALYLAKGAYALNIARGAAPAIAAARAATVATAAGAISEGALGGAQSEREVRDEIEKLPIETLRKSDAFNALTHQGMSDDAARQSLARDMGTRAFVTGGIATGIFGGMGDRIIAKTFLGKEGGKGIADTLKRLGASGLGEGLAEELPQSALQQVAQNEAVQHANPDKSLMDDVANQALGGAVTGGVMGVGMGAAFHGATHDMAPAPEQTQPAAAPTAAPESQTAPQPAASPAPPAPANKGPLSAALEAGAPAHAAMSDVSGKRVILTDKVGQMAGHIIGQDADGVMFRGDDGNEQLIGHDEISSGQVTIAEAAGAPKQEEAKPLPQAEHHVIEEEPAKADAAKAEEPAKTEAPKAEEAPAPKAEESKPAESAPDKGGIVFEAKDYDRRIAQRAEAISPDAFKRAYEMDNQIASLRQQIADVSQSKPEPVNYSATESELNRRKSNLEARLAGFSGKRRGSPAAKQTIEKIAEIQAQLDDLPKRAKDDDAKFAKMQADRVQAMRLALNDKINDRGRMGPQISSALKKAQAEADAIGIERLPDAPKPAAPSVERPKAVMPPLGKLSDAKPEAPKAEAPAPKVEPVKATEPAPKPEAPKIEEAKAPEVAQPKEEAPAPAAKAAEPAKPLETAPASDEPRSSLAEDAAAKVKERPKPQNRSHAEMSEPELRDRLKYLTDQARGANGWNKPLINERAKIEAELASRGSAASEAAPQTANEKVGQELTDRLKHKPAEEGATALPTWVAGKFKPVWNAMTEEGRRAYAEKYPAVFNRALAPGEGEPRGEFDKQQSEIHRDLTARKSEFDASKPAATEKPKPITKEQSDHLFGVDKKREAALARIRTKGAWFGKREGAEKFIKDGGLSATHEIKQTGKSRFDVVEKPAEGFEKFPAESGTLGIPRAEMPQVPTEAHGGLVKHLNAQGIEHETKMVDAADLKPTQAEFSPEKVEKAKDAEGDRSIIVSNDGHIIDGHHQALAAKEEGKDVKAIVLDAPVHEALEAVKNSPSATDDKGRKLVGKNEAGNELWGDARGVRSYVENGVRVSEPVGIRPGSKEISVDRTNRHEWATAEERAAQQQTAAPEKSADYGADNKLVSKERYEQLRARLKQKFKEAGTQFNSGIDPEFMSIGAEAAAYHIEAGARKFADFAHAIARDLEIPLAGLKKYLRSWYNGARDMLEDAGHNIDGMDNPDVVRSELARVLAEAEKQDAGTAIHENGAGPLEEVASGNDQGNAQGRNAERGSSEGEQAGGRTGGEPNGERPATARSGGVRSSGTDSTSAGEVKPKKPKKGAAERGAEIAEKAKEEPRLFEQSPSVEERETAPINVPATNFVLTDDMRIGKGTEGEKYSDNLAAIRTLKQIEEEGRRATPEEKGILARYVGWGGLKNAFRVAGAADGEGVAKGWEKRVAELEGLLTPPELRAARNSTAAAHYTSPTVVKAVWRAVERLGFAGGAVLEPSVGTGNFLGFMPEAARGKSDVFAVEYDSLTARIAQALYPNMDVVHSGFQDVPLPSNQFALAIGNPPFGADKLNFRYNQAVNGKTIHNQFFLASLDGVREGGLMAMVVSHNLMDSLDREARLALAAKGEFMGAIRLPDTAFKENARTEVVTDIIFLKKREVGDFAYRNLNDKDSGKGKEENPINDAIAAVRAGGTGGLSMAQRNSPELQRAWDEISGWVNSQTIDDPAGSGERINANGYFLKNPDMVIGKIDATGTMNRRAELNVRLENPAELEDRLNKAIDRLPRRAPSNEVAESSRKYYKTMVEGMKLAIQRAEPGAVRQDLDGSLKTVVDMDAGEGNAKSVLREITLTADTPFNPDYTMNLDGQWQRTLDVLDDKGNKIKVVNDEGKTTNRNAKEVKIYSEADIPAKDKWGAQRVAAVRAMLPIRNLIKRQLLLEMQDAQPKMIEANRAKLNEAYEKFVAAHGELHAPANAKIALTMPDGGLIMATESVAKKGGAISKSAIMSRRVTEPPKTAERAKDASDAVAISLAEGGKIDLDRVAALLNTDEAGAVKALSEGDEPRAFYDPEKSGWEPADLYLSGLVRKKLLAAKEAGLDANVKALEKVIPADWDSSQIVPNIGSAWIPPDIYAGFLKSLGYSKATAHYSPVTNTFTTSFDGEPTPQWKTTGAAMSAGEIVSKLLNSQPIKVMTPKDSEGRTYVNEEATAESQAKASELFNEFLDWAYKDDARRERMVRIFNDKFNTRVVRQRDGSHLTLPGKVPDTVIRMRRHQNNAIWRGITDRSVLYDHVVGAGKTFTAIARIMERKRMGLSRKPLVVVPNHLVEQWAHDAKALYPGANVLAAGADDFERANRRRLFARIATGDYDMTIIGHSSFGFIDLDPATEERYLMDELRSAQAAVSEAEDAAQEEGYSGWQTPMGVREAERLVTKIETRLSRLRNLKRDRLLTFEEMGVDDLTIDEAHEFKNLAYSSRLAGVVGMGNKTGSQKASDLHMKVRSLNDRHGTSVAFLTGTPMSNSVAEMYLVLRNLAPNEMHEMGIDNFDAWRSMYVSYASAFEPTEAGGLKEVTRLGREWMNMKSLMDLYYSVSDSVNTEDIQKAYSEDNGGKPFPIPNVRSKVAGKGDRETVIVKPTPEQREVLTGIVSGFNSLPDISDPKERNIARLRLMDRARKVSLDPRAVDPHTVVSSEGGKISAIVNRVSNIYHRSTPDKGTQIIFLDRSVPKAKGDDKKVAAYDALRERLKAAMEAGNDKEEQKVVGELEKYDPNEMEALRTALAGGWNAYDEIKRQLIAKGIPENEIRFVQEATNDKQKAALFDQVNNGDVRVLIGSTPRMGAGTNVQKRLVALHHGDVTWKPSDIEQREGRIVRQGNELLAKYGPDWAVDVIAYATEDTIDAKMWNLNSQKLKAINGIRKYDGSFHMEFEDEESASMAEMAALATGNPLMVERVTLDSGIKKLEMQERSFNRRRNAMRDQLSAAKRAVETAPARIEENRSFAAKLDKSLAGVRERADARNITVEGKAFNSPDDAQMAAEEAVKKIRGADTTMRFSIEVGGQKVTSMDAIDKAIRSSFGTHEFEATVDGKPTISAHEAALGVMEMAKGKGDEFTLDGITLNGVPVEIDVAPYKWGKGSGEREVTYSALNDAGKQMAAYRTVLGNMTASGIRVGLEKLADKLDPSEFRYAADHAKRGAAGAEKEIPGLEKEVEKAWPHAEDLKAKRERLQEVTGTLAQASDPNRLTAEPKASIGDDTGTFDATGLREHLSNGEDGSLISRMIDSGKVVIHDNASTLPPGAPAGTVQGVAMPDGTIHLVAGNLSPESARGVLLHEAFHSGAEPLVGSRGWKTLMERVQAAANAAMKREVAGDRNSGFWRDALDRAMKSDVPTQHLAEEVAAYAVESRENAPAGIRDAIDNFIGQVKAWALKRFGRQFGDVTPGQLHALARAALRSWSSESGPTTPGPDGNRYSMKDGKDKPAKGGKSLYDKAKDRASDFLTDAMGRNETFNLLKLTPVRPLFLELAKDMPAAKHYIDTKQAMDAMRHRLNHEDAGLLDKWSKWVREGFGKKNKAENRELMDIMHESTLEQVDPSKEFVSKFTEEHEKSLRRARTGSDAFDVLSKMKAEDEERKVARSALGKRYDALSPIAKEIYNEVRDAYSERADATEKEVISNVRRALDTIVRKAREAHAEEMQRIADEGLTGEAKDDAIKTADLRLATVETRVVRNRAARMKRLREQFESNRMDGPYFPLARFGNYFVTVRTKEGKVLSFSRFEKAAEQREFADEMEKNPAYVVERGGIERNGSETAMPDAKFVADIDSILEGADAPSEVRDQVWQRYLETLPDLSMRKHRIHRKGRAGYNTDALRAFAFNMFHSAHQLSRLRYGQEMQGHMDEARQQVRNAANPTRAQAVYNEMLNAHNFAMNPKGNALAYRATSMAFLWTMGWNLSTGLVVLHDPIQRGIPNLAYDVKTGNVGIKKASTELAGAFVDVLRGKGSAENSSKLTNDERDAMARARDLGVIENTNAHDLAGVSEAGIDYSPLKNTAMKTASMPLHHAERVNREVTFLAAYRIAREKGLAHAEAVKNAADLTWMSQFDTQSSSKPAIMRNDMGRVVLALRNFHANILYRFFKDFHESIHGMAPEAKKAATGRLVSSLLITAGMAGVRGAYFYSYVLPIAAALLAAAGLRDPDKDPEEQLRKSVLDATGDTMIGRAVGGMLMDGIPGYFTGTALSGRIGVPDIGLRSPDREMNPEQAWNYWLAQMLGPAVDVPHGVAMGVGDISKGEVARGLEKMLPASARNGLKAIRYAREGVRDKNGNAIVENVAPQDIAKQALGFTPAEIADRRARNTFQMNEQTRIHEEKSQALRGAAKARMAGEGQETAQEKVEHYNERFPEARIKAKSIKTEVKRMRSKADRMEYGVDLDGKLADRINSDTAPSIYSRK